LTDGITESDGDFWDSEGQLIALARQTMKVKVPEEGSNLGREA
jgi:acyl-CoA thioesterase